MPVKQTHIMYIYFKLTLYESTPPSGLIQVTSNFSVSNPTTGVTVRSCTLSGTKKQRYLVLLDAKCSSVSVKQVYIELTYYK